MTVELLVLGAVIGSNNFAASLALGSFRERLNRWRIVGVFGAFEFLVPLLGLWLGQQTARAIGDMVWWIGPAALALLGGWTVYSAFKSREDDQQLAARITHWRGLAALAAGLSIDNLVAGFSLGLGGLQPIVMATTIAIFSMVFTYLGLRIGHLASRNHRQLAKIITGILLCGLAMLLALGVL